MRGRRPHTPSPEQSRQVLLMTGMGILQVEIARWLSIDLKTLRKRYRRELDTGATEANLRVAQSLFQMATKERVPAAAIFWLKARADWKDGSGVAINNTQVAVGGIDRPPRETLEQWLERRRRELAALDGPHKPGNGANGAANGESRGQ